jgi:hypothetical protein
MRNAYRILVMKAEGRGLLDRPTRIWKDNIEMGHVYIGWGVMDWIDAAQDGNRERLL